MKNYVILYGQYLNIFSDTRTYFYCVIHGGTTFFKNVEAISKFMPPEGWHEARSILRTHKHWRRRLKFIRPSDPTPGICASWKNKKLNTKITSRPRIFFTRRTTKNCNSIQDVYKMLGQTSRVSSSYKTKQTSHINSPEMSGLWV